jgi:hypothetical protein
MWKVKRMNAARIVVLAIAAGGRASGSRDMINSETVLAGAGVLAGASAAASIRYRATMTACK